MTTSVFACCCVLPMFFRPFFWFRRLAERRAGITMPRVFRKCRPTRDSGFAGRGEGRRTAPDPSGPRAGRKAGRQRGIARAGRIEKHGYGQASKPAVPAPTRRTKPRDDCSEQRGIAGAAADQTHRPRDRRGQRRCRCDRTRSGESSRRAGGQSRRRCGSRARTDHCPANPTAQPIPLPSQSHCPANPTAVPGAGRAAAC